MSTPTKKDLLAQAGELGLELDPGLTKKQISQRIEVRQDPRTAAEKAGLLAPSDWEDSQIEQAVVAFLEAEDDAVGERPAPPRSMRRRRRSSPRG